MERKGILSIIFRHFFQHALPPQTPGRPGKNSPWRDRPKSESLDLEWFPATNLKLYCMSLTTLPEVRDKMLRVWL